MADPIAAVGRGLVGRGVRERAAPALHVGAGDAREEQEQQRSRGHVPVPVDRHVDDEGDAARLQGGQQAAVGVARRPSQRPQRGDQQAAHGQHEQHESDDARLAEHVDPLVVRVLDDDGASSGRG